MTWSWQAWGHSDARCAARVAARFGERRRPTPTSFSPAAEAIAPAPVAGPVPEDAGAAPLHEPPWKRQPKKRANSGGASPPWTRRKARRRQRAKRSTCRAAEHEDAPTAEGAGLPDEPIEAAEVESPPIVPVDLDEGRPPIDIDAADFAERSIGPGADVEKRRRPPLPVGSRKPAALAAVASANFILALVIVDAIVVGWRNDFVRLFPADFRVLRPDRAVGEPARRRFRGRHHDCGAARGRADPGGPGQHRQHRPQGRRRAADQIHRPQRRPAGNLFLDRRAGAHRVIAGRGRPIPQPARLAADRRPTMLVRFVNRRDVLAGTR